MATGGPAVESLTHDRLEGKVWVAGALMILVGAVTSILILREVSSDSYLYLAFYSIPANAAISVFPHEPVLIYFGQMGSVLWAAVAASVGTIIAGYLDHTVFVSVLSLRHLSGYKDKRLYRNSIRYFMRWPFATLLVAGFTPIPFWPFKFLTFSIRYPIRKYILALTLARFPRYLVLAWLGATVPIPTWVLIACFAAVVLLYLIQGAPAALDHWRRGRG